MKTILVATDFSDVARNAIDYAAEIAKVTDAKLVLFNVYHDPIFLAEIPVSLPIDEIEKDTLESLNEIAKEIRNEQDRKLLIECVCKQGMPVQEINLYAKENDVDLIVMGMETTSYLSEKIVGNITTSLIKKASCPVLAIDKHVKFRSIKNIVLACDYLEITSKTVLDPLLEFVRMFDSKIYVLNVLQELETVTTVSKAAEGIKLNHSLNGVTHSFHYSKSEDVIEGINEFVEEKKIDMVVMIPRVHTALYNLFHESHTKRMAFHTKIPLLALHE